MFFKDSDRDVLFSLLEYLKTIKDRQDSHNNLLQTVKDRQLIAANSIDTIQASLERIIARLDLFIKEFESIKPLATELKQLIQSTNQTKKR